MAKVILIVLVALLVVVGALFAIGWVFSSRVIVPAPYTLMPEFDMIDATSDINVDPDIDVGPDAITPDEGQGAVVTLPLVSDPKQHANTLVEGVYGLLWEGGHVLLGEVRSRAAGSVTRSLGPVAGTQPSAGAPARIDNFVYREDPLADLGIEFEDLMLEGQEGALRAWFVPATSRIAGSAGTGRTAVLLLHGRRRGELIETLRMIEPLHELGLPTLALAYRNHDLSDPSSDGLFHYGADEWQDALVGARELAARGADRVVLYGLSMGGAVALEALKRWTGDLPEVVGVVLDSPLIDVYDVIELGAVKSGLPLPAQLTKLALFVAGLRTGVDFSQLSQARTAATIPVPVMVIAGTADTTVPIASIDTFTAAVRTPLTYHRLDGVEHVEAWNRDPERYAGWLRAFFSGLEIRADGSLPHGVAVGR